MRVLLAGDGHGAHAVYNGLYNKKIYPDVCSNDKHLIEICLKNGSISVDSILEWARSVADIVVTAGYKPIIPPNVLNNATILNVHYSLLPKYRGFHSIVWAMLNGEEEVGYTVHLMDALIDNGDIVWQTKVKVDNKTSWELMMEIDDLVKQEIGSVIWKYLNKEITTCAQNYMEATFVAKRNTADCMIQWDMEDLYIERMLKALVDPYPKPFFVYKDKKYEIESAEVVHRHYIEMPGHVVYKDKKSVWIKLKKGLLRLYKLQFEGQTVDATEVITKTGYRL